jgi:NAD-dependent SIR2 family protein deacetylase
MTCRRSPRPRVSPAIRPRCGPSTTPAGANLAGAAPNAAHAALARLQTGLAARGGRLFLCTQNVDDLHEQGGCADVIHMHGELRVTRCHAARRPGRTPDR